MTREDLLKEFLSLKGSNFLLELPTGVGKSRLAIEKLKSLVDQGTLLIVISRHVHKEVWEKEITKWWNDCPLFIEFTTYYSLSKHVGEYTAVIYDEVQHLSPACQVVVPKIRSKYNILCSATVTEQLHFCLSILFNPLIVFKKTINQVTMDGILPMPTLYLIPLSLSSEEQIEYSRIDRQVQYWNRLFRSTYKISVKNKWLHTAGERLKWLSNHKVKIAQEILKRLDAYRTITFCNNIEQTEVLGQYCINSKNPKSKEWLQLFNNKELNHITSCNMLNEGVNLAECQIGIFVNLNSSKIITVQRLGRILRAAHPIIILPYFLNTRDAELIENIISNYDANCVKTIYSIDDLVTNLV